jgi:hypothetical protein
LASQTAQQPSVFDLPKVLAVGVVSPAAAALTASFGVAGTLLGLFLSSVLVTAGVDLLKVYLARVPGAVTSIPGGFRKKSAWGRLLQRMRLPFSKFSSLPHPRRRSLLIGSIAAAGVSFLVGLIIVTGVEASVGKSLSCSLWNNCPTESSTSTTGDGSTSQPTSTLASIIGRSQGAVSNTPKVAPSSPQQQHSGGSSAPGTPQSPSQAPGRPGAETPPGVETPTPSAPSAQPGQRQGPSGVMQDQQQAPSNSVPADQQSSSSEEQLSSSDQQQSSSNQQSSSSE